MCPSENIITSSTQKTERARAMWPAIEVRSPRDCALCSFALANSCARGREQRGDVLGDYTTR